MTNWQNAMHLGLQRLSSLSHITWMWIVAGISVLAVTVLWIGQYASPGKRIELFGKRNLTSDEISLMQVAFGNAELNDYEIRGNSIHVPRQKRAAYLQALSRHDAIPRDLSAGQKESTFDFFLTRSQQRQKQLEQKKRRIRDMVAQMNFVQSVMVDYDETKNGTPFADLQRSAIVTIKPTGNRVLEPNEIQAVRDTVRGAVAGLKAADVIITDMNCNRSYSGALPFSNESVQPLTHVKNMEEAKYEIKIRNALAAYHGVRVNVEVAVDPILHRRFDQQRVSGEPVTISRTVQRETSQRLHHQPSDVANRNRLAGINGQAVITRSSNDSQVDRSIETTQSISNGSYETRETAGLTVNHVSVSIGIPERCVEYLVSREINFNRDDSTDQRAAGERQQDKREIFQQIARDIRMKVKPLLPQLNPLDDQIVVTMDPDIPFDGGSNPQVAAPVSTSWIANHWRTLALIGFGLAALAILRIKPSTSPESREYRDREFNELQYSKPLETFRSPSSAGDSEIVSPDRDHEL